MYVTLVLKLDIHPLHQCPIRLLELVAESKALVRLGVSIPDSARTVQEQVKPQLLSFSLHSLSAEILVCLEYREGEREVLKLSSMFCTASVVFLCVTPEVIHMLD